MTLPESTTITTAAHRRRLAERIAERAETYARCGLPEMAERLADAAREREAEASEVAP